MIKFIKNVYLNSRKVKDKYHFENSQYFFCRGWWKEAAGAQELYTMIRNCKNSFRISKIYSVILLLINVEPPSLRGAVQSSSSSVDGTLLFEPCWFFTSSRWSKFKSCSLFNRWLSEDVWNANVPTKTLSQTVESVTPAYWHAFNPPEFDRETGDRDDDWVEYGLEKPDECCLAFKRNVAMLELMAVPGSAVVRWWYIEYGFVGVV
jgi:hypothetical protein